MYAAIQARDLAVVNVGADDIIAGLGQSRADHQTNVSGTDYAYSHPALLQSSCRLRCVADDGAESSPPPDAPAMCCGALLPLQLATKLGPCEF